VPNAHNSTRLTGHDWGGEVRTRKRSHGAAVAILTSVKLFQRHVGRITPYPYIPHHRIFTILNDRHNCYLTANYYTCNLLDLVGGRLQ
jgi:hypothetical protein